MKRIPVVLVSLGVALIAATHQIGTIRAQESGVTQDQVVTKMMPPYPRGVQLPGFIGQEHAYTVTLRGNGEAVVSGRIVFTNTNQNPLERVELRVPRVEPKDLIAFQLLREPTCIQYQPMPLGAQECRTYQEPDYYQHWWGSTKYQKAAVVQELDTVSVTLPQPVKADASGAILLYFRAFGYAKRNLVGAYNYTFETLKVEDPIRDLTVGITTDSDLVLKGVKGKVNYRFSDLPAALKSTEAGIASTNVQFDQYYQNIGQGVLTKKATNLQPLDSYTVRGAYAERWIQVYAKETAIVVAVIAFVIIALVLIGKRVLGVFVRSHGEHTDGAVEHHKESTQSMLESVGASFIASFLIILYTVFLYAGRSVLENTAGDDFWSVMVMLFILISFLVYGSLLIGPVFLVGLRRGIAWGFAAFGLTIVWLVVGGVTIVVILGLFRRNIMDFYPSPIGIMGIPEQARIETVQERSPALPVDEPVSNQ